MSAPGPLRVLVVLAHSLHLRNFVASGVLDLLASHGHRTTLVLPETFIPSIARDLAHLTPAPVLEPLEPHTGGRVRQRLRALFRTASYVQRSHLSTYRHKLDVRGTSVADRVEVGLLRGAGRVGDLEALARAVERRIPPRRSAVALVRGQRPDVVVTPTFIHDTLDLEIVKAARSSGVPVVGFPASWDTLTSKGCFLVPPDVLMVWGEDTHRHAVEYHDYAADRVAVTGPPHFDQYAPGTRSSSRERFLVSRGIDPRRRVILFAGTTVTYWADEPLQLRALSRLIERGELPGCSVWYRPHPRRRARDVSELMGLPGVHVDDQLLRQKASGAGAYSPDREDLAHYRDLLDAVDGVVTAFSTMIIEAALVGKPSLVVAFGLAPDGAGHVLQHAEYEHMRDVVSTPGVTMCRSLDDVAAGIRRIVGGEWAAFSEVLRKRASEIAHCLDGRARERIVEVIERVGREGRPS